MSDKRYLYSLGGNIGVLLGISSLNGDLVPAP